MNNDLYQLAIERWGKGSQLIVAIEELSELTKEISKFQRGMGNRDHLAEELADVEIMCEQLRYIFLLDPEVDYWKGRKLRRLAERLK